MAINILVEPQNPPIAGDYTLDQAIQQACETPVGSILTLWEDTASIPAAQQTSFIRHAGNTFQVQGSNEAISGSLSAGINYIAATETAGVITLAWVTSLTGYSYNQAYGGIYNGSGLQLLRDICYVDGTDNIRGRIFGHDFNSYYLANGDIYSNNLISNNDISSGNDIVVGNNLTVTGDTLTEGLSLTSITPTGTRGSQVVAGGGLWTPAAGIYTIIDSTTATIEVQIRNTVGTWVAASVSSASVSIMTDGAYVRIRNNSGVSRTYTYLSI